MEPTPPRFKSKLGHLPRTLLPCGLFASGEETAAIYRAVLSTELKFVYLEFEMV